MGAQQWTVLAGLKVVQRKGLRKQERDLEREARKCLDCFSFAS